MTLNTAKRLFLADGETNTPHFQITDVGLLVDKKRMTGESFTRFQKILNEKGHCDLRYFYTTTAISPIPANSSTHIISNAIQLTNPSLVSFAIVDAKGKLTGVL